MECALQDNSIPKTAGEGFRKRKQQERTSERSSICWTRIFKEKGPNVQQQQDKRDSPESTIYLEAQKDLGVCISECFTLTEALKLMDLWGRRIDPSCLDA